MNKILTSKKMKIFKMYKKGKSENKRLQEMDIDKKIMTKSIIFSIIFTIIIALPCISVISSLLTVFSTIRTMFWVTLVLIYIFLAIVYAGGSAFNVVLLKNYIETEEVKSLDTKAIFVSDLLNPLILLAGLLIDFVICKMAM
jgi:hypothetical protein